MTRKITKQQLAELESGDGIYYIAQERLCGPDFPFEWPVIVKIKGNKYKRLVKREVSK